MQVNRIKDLRRAANMSLEQVAERFGVDPSTVHRWETGEIEMTSRRMLELAGLFGVTPGALMGWDAGEGEAA